MICDQVHLCELVGSVNSDSPVNVGPAGRPTILVTVKALRADADEKARCVALLVS